MRRARRVRLVHGADAEMKPVSPGTMPRRYLSFSRVALCAAGSVSSTNVWRSSLQPRHAMLTDEISFNKIWNSAFENANMSDAITANTKTQFMCVSGGFIPRVAELETLIWDSYFLHKRQIIMAFRGLCALSELSISSKKADRPRTV